MRKLFVLIVILMLTGCVTTQRTQSVYDLAEGAGADVKVSAMTADTSPTNDDLVVTVNDPGGTPANRKVTLENLLKAGNSGINAGTDLTADLEEEVTEGSLANDTIVEADLKVVDAPADEDILTSESTTGDFEWHSLAETLSAMVGANTGLLGLSSGAYVDVDTIAEIETAIGGSTNILVETEIDAGSELLALFDDETGTGVPVFNTSPAFLTSMTLNNGFLFQPAANTDGHTIVWQMYGTDGGSSPALVNFLTCTNDTAVSANNLPECAFANVDLTLPAVSSMIIADSGTFTFDESAADPNDADVRLSAADGVLTLISVNGANNENMTIDLDATSDVVTFNSGTSATFAFTPNVAFTGAITEGGNAVYNSGETPGGELGGTWASPTVDDTGITLTSITIGALLGVDSIDATGAVDMDYGSADVTDHTFTSDGGVTIIDGATITAAAANDPWLIWDESDGTDTYLVNDDTGNQMEFSLDSTASSNNFFVINIDGSGVTIGDGGDDDIVIAADNDDTDGTITRYADEKTWEFSNIIGIAPQTYDATDQDATDFTIGTTGTSSIILVTGDNDGDNDSIDLQNSTRAGQIVRFYASANIDADDTVTVNMTDTTCTGCTAVVMDEVGDSFECMALTTSLWNCYQLNEVP